MTLGIARHSDEIWMRTRTPNGRWFSVTWDKEPTVDDIDHMMKVLEVAREGYVIPTPLKEVCGIPVLRLVHPYEMTA